MDKVGVCLNGIPNIVFAMDVLVMNKGKPLSNLKWIIIETIYEKNNSYY